MADNRPPRPEPPEVNTRALTKLGIAFILAGIAAQLLVWSVFEHFKQPAKAPSRYAGRDAGRLPPEPRLQRSPIEDMQQMRAVEDQLLNSYAWIDPGRGLVRIPVSRAMDLIAREGLPHRAQPGPVTTDTATIPTESGLGPKVHQEGGPLSTK